MENKEKVLDQLIQDGLHEFGRGVFEVGSPGTQTVLHETLLSPLAESFDWSGVPAAVSPLPLPALSDLLPRADFTSGEDDSLDDAVTPPTPIAARRTFRLPPAQSSRIPGELDPVLFDRYQVAPPSRIPVPGCGDIAQFILLGGAVNSQFKQILSQAEVKARVERFGALVINICQPAVDNPETPAHQALRAEVADFAVSLPGIIGYYDVNLADRPGAPICDHLFTYIPLIDEAVKNNKQVFIYCGKGISRSASFVLGYLILAKNMTDSEANDHVLAFRSIAPILHFSAVLSILSHDNQGIIGNPLYGEISLSDKIARLNAPDSDPLVEGFPFRNPPSPILAPVAAVEPGVGLSEVLPGTNPFSRSMGSVPPGLDLSLILESEAGLHDGTLTRSPLSFFPRASSSGFGDGFLPLPGGEDEAMMVPGSGRRSRTPSR